MALTARALIAVDGRYSLEDVELGDPAAGEVLVALRASGVCRTDLELLAEGFSHVMGHEGAGEVLACGPGVTHVAPGDRVLLNWATPCGVCYQCRRGAENICDDRPRVPPERRTWRGRPVSPSFGLATMATHTVVPAAAAVKMDVSIPFESASLLGCSVMSGFGAVINSARVRPGSSVVVLGSGGVGLSCIQGAVHARASTIIAVDVNDRRLQAARRFGATHVLRASPEDAGLLGAARDVKALVGRGADYAFECTAEPSLAAAPLAMVASGGVAIALSRRKDTVPMDMRLFEFDKLYMAPLYGQCRPQIDFPMLLELYANRRLELDGMVTGTYPLTAEGLDLAFRHMLDGNNVKSVLVPD